MKRNTKRFLALGLAVLLAGSPVAHVQAEEGEHVEIVEQSETSAVAVFNETTVKEEADVEEETAQEETVEEETVEEETLQEETVQEEIVEEEKTEETEKTDTVEETEESEEKELIYTSIDPVFTTIAENLFAYRSETFAVEDNLVEKESTERKTYAITINATSNMYAMGNAVVTEQEDGSYLLRMQQSRENRNYMAITEDQNAAINHTVNWYVSDTDYYYTIPIVDLRQPLYVCFSSTDKAIKGEFSNIVKLTFDVSSMEETNQRAASASDIHVLPAVLEEADYTSVDSALETIPEDLSIYTDDTVGAVIAAKNAVVRGYNKEKQEEVDKMAADIIEAVAALVMKDSIEESELKVNNTTPMFKILKAEIIKDENGRYVLAMTLNSKGYQHLFLGTYEQAVANGDNRENWISGELVNDKYCFMIPISGNETNIPIVSISNNKLKDYEDGKISLEQTFYPRQIIIDYSEKILTAGDFDCVNPLTITNEVTMFSVVSAALQTIGGPNSNNYEEILQLTMGSDSFDKIYIGSAESAAIATSVISIESRNASIPIRKNETGGSLLFDYLEKPTVMAFHSVKKDLWYERVLTVSKTNNTLVITPSDGNSGNKPDGSDVSGGNNNKPDGNENTIDQESGHVTDLSGGTIRVNNTTTLKDGTYTPDQFSWSGGTGRVGISCNKITVKNGQAYATIVFGSGSYSYIKANGSIYYGTNTGSTSTFVIPVALNKNNTIIGMTTAMSVAHEIRYNIFIYLAAAAQGEQAEVLNNQKLDEQAPVIAGLTYEEEIEMEYTEYVKLYRYENDILLLEIDMKTDTERELVEGETENLYEGNVVKYLIVPEDAEIPVGLEKNVVIIQKPVEKAYIADEEILSLLKEIGVDEEILLEGEKEEPDYKEIVKNKCNLAILSSDLLEEEDEETLLEVSERFATLQIPLFVDRMEDEEEEEAKLEWLKVYGVIFDCEEKANEIYEEKLAEIKAQ